MTTPERTPWRAWLKLAAQLGVPPSAFWRLSAREWRALLAAPTREALGHEGFEALAARFPDEVK